MSKSDKIIGIIGISVGLIGIWATVMGIYNMHDYTHLSENPYFLTVIGCLGGGMLGSLLLNVSYQVN